MGRLSQREHQPEEPGQQNQQTGSGLPPALTPSLLAHSVTHLTTQWHALTDRSWSQCRRREFEVFEKRSVKSGKTQAAEVFA
jgi:hypothetical protein